MEAAGCVLCSDTIARKGSALAEMGAGTSSQRTLQYQAISVFVIVLPVAVAWRHRKQHDPADGGADGGVGESLAIEDAADNVMLVQQPGPADLVDTLSLLLPFFGPKSAVHLRIVAHEFNQTYNDKTLITFSRTGMWQEWCKESARPLVELIDKSSDISVLRSAAKMGQFSDLDVWRPDSGGKPPLIKVASRSDRNAGSDSRNAALIQALLDVRATPNCTDRYGWTPLMWASFAGNSTACQSLLQGKANVNHFAGDGTTALNCATQAPVSQLEVFKVLLSAGANPTVVPTQGACGDHWEAGVLQLLLSACRAYKKHASFAKAFSN